MPSPEYHRKQAETFAGLALLASNENEVNWYKLIAMEHFALAAREPMYDDSGSDSNKMRRFPMTHR
jgi:hypothetical protein